MEYLFTQFRVVVTYLRLLVAPVSQSLDYDYPRYASFLNVPVFISFALLAGFLTLSLAACLKSRAGREPLLLAASLGVFWFFVTISIESSVIPLYDVIFEHRVYLPSVGAVAAFASAVFYLRQRALHIVPSRRAVAAFLAILVVAYATAAFLRNGVWSDPVKLWADTVQKSPQNPRALYNLGWAYMRAGRMEDAQREFRESIRVGVDNRMTVMALNNLAGMLCGAGKVDEAVELVSRAIKIEPQFAPTRYNMGVIYAQAGDYRMAMREFIEAIRLRPDYSEAHNNLGKIHFMDGRIDEALREYEEAIRLKPTNALAHYNIAECLKTLGREDEAKEQMEIYSRLIGREP